MTRQFKVWNTFDPNVLEQLRQTEDNPSMSWHWTASLGDSFMYMGKYADALSMCDDCLKLKKQRLGDDHPGTTAIIE
jgi:hypothetical protein